MKLAVVLIAFLLTACKTIYVPIPPPEFPPVGEKMMYKCPELLLAKDSEKLSELLETVTKNYGTYHTCKAAVEAWHLWYAEQKANHERLVNEQLHSK